MTFYLQIYFFPPSLPAISGLIIINQRNTLVNGNYISAAILENKKMLQPGLLRNGVCKDITPRCELCSLFYAKFSMLIFRDILHQYLQILILKISNGVMKMS